MSEFECPTCGPKWNGCYTLEHRCVTCGSVIHVAEPWREESEEVADAE